MSIAQVFKDLDGHEGVSCAGAATTAIMVNKRIIAKSLSKPSGRLMSAAG